MHLTILQINLFMIKANYIQRKNPISTLLMPLQSPWLILLFKRICTSQFKEMCIFKHDYEKYALPSHWFSTNQLSERFHERRTEWMAEFCILSEFHQLCTPLEALILFEIHTRAPEEVQNCSTLFHSFFFFIFLMVHFEQVLKRWWWWWWWQSTHCLHQTDLSFIFTIQIQNKIGENLHHFISNFQFLAHFFSCIQLSMLNEKWKFEDFYHVARLKWTNVQENIFVKLKKWLF